MRPIAIDFLEFLLLVLGAGLAFSGWRAVRRRRATAEGHEYRGRGATLLGWLWLALGLLLLLAALTDIAFFKALGRTFLESSS